MDAQQLEPMVKAAKEQLQQSELSVTADAGYSSGKQFQAFETPRTSRGVCLGRLQHVFTQSV